MTTAAWLDLVHATVVCVLWLFVIADLLDGGWSDGDSAEEASWPRG